MTAPAVGLTGPAVVGGPAIGGYGAGYGAGQGVGLTAPAVGLGGVGVSGYTPGLGVSGYGTGVGYSGYTTGVTPPVVFWFIHKNHIYWYNLPLKRLH